MQPGRSKAQACSAPTGRDPNAGSGTPPLLFHGGKMMATRSNGDKVIVTPIYWAPTGYSFASSYPTLVNRYLADAAHDSDKSTNVFSTLFEYNGSNGYINYRQQRGTPITDTTPFPAAGCTTSIGPVYSDNSGYSTCMDDAQVQSEIQAVLTAHGLHSDLGHIYPLFLPKHVESCIYPGNPVNQACTLNASPSSSYCAYHSMISPAGTVYANMPFPVYSSRLPFTCGSDASFPTEESPNANPDADTVISPLSHELSEAITDADTSTGWFDSSGYENGDECAYEYGASSGAAGALYNQTLNGHHYLSQEEFSNNNYNQNRGGCMQSYVPAAAPKVSALSSRAGSTSGGATMTLTGSMLAGATSVTFGATAAKFSVIDQTHLKVTTPAHAAGTVDVRVHNAVGISPIVSADGYTYS